MYSFFTHTITSPPYFDDFHRFVMDHGTIHKKKNIVIELKSAINIYLSIHTYI
jgi:hypothetical protein